MSIVQWITQQPTFNTSVNDVAPSIVADADGNSYVSYETIGGTASGQTNTGSSQGSATSSQSTSGTSAQNSQSATDVNSTTPQSTTNTNLDQNTTGTTGQFSRGIVSRPGKGALRSCLRMSEDSLGI